MRDFFGKKKKKSGGDFEISFFVKLEDIRRRIVKFLSRQTSVTNQR